MPREVTETARANRRAVRRTVGSVILLFGAYSMLPFRGERWWVGALVGLSLVITMVPFAVSRLRRVLTSERPGFEAVEALVLLLSMLIVGFSAVYYALNRDGVELIGLKTKIDATYFTVTTLSTVGFGDISAASQVARFIVTVQVVFDLLFIGVAVRVFANAAQRRMAAPTESD